MRRNNAYNRFALVVIGFAASWAMADTVYVPEDYPTIQAAIDACADGDEVVVADGTWTGTGNRDLDFGGKLITVRSENGAAACIIDCEGAGRGFYFHNGETADAVVDGFTIRNGTASSGGAIYCSYSGPTIVRCRFERNSATASGGTNGGGAIYNFYSAPTVTECEFSDNWAARVGGGVRNERSGGLTMSKCTFSGNSASYAGGMGNFYGSPTVANCLFEDNSADLDCGGLEIGQSSDVTVENCVFRANTAGRSAGGMEIWFESNPTIINCTFENNSASWRGGGMINWTDCSPTVINCAFTGNSAFGGGTAPGGGGMFNFNGCNPTVINCTFSDNLATDGGAIYNYLAGTTANLTNCILWGDSPNEIVLGGGTTITVRYSDVQGGWPGVGNIDADPLFVDPNNADYHLSGGSPCIDAADNTAVPPDVTTDLDGRLRFADRIGTPDTGNGDPPIVDMGAYEYQCTGDLDGDGDIDLSDLAQLLSNYGMPSGAIYADGDLDQDGDVDLSDLAALLAVYGTTCE